MLPLPQYVFSVGRDGFRSVPKSSLEADRHQEETMGQRRLLVFPLFVSPLKRGLKD